MLAFTICSNNYLPYAAVLSKSVKRVHPDWLFILCLVDHKGPDEWYENGRFDGLIEVEELKIPDFTNMVANYSLVELNTAVKPYFFSHLFESFPHKVSLIYLDPDIQVFSPMSEVVDSFEKSSIILVPHFSTPQFDQPGIITPENRILQRGLYNLGFLGLKRSRETAELLDWWKVKLQDQCLISPRKGLFVDQKWMDLAPLYFDNTVILKNLGYDVAYWNLYENSLQYKGADLYANDHPLRFYHFSAFDKNSSDYVENLANKFNPRMGVIIRELYSSYHALLNQEKLIEYQTIPCVYSQTKPKHQGIFQCIKAVFRKWCS